MHGDYLFGWKGDSLQKALDARCSGDRCSALKTQSADAAAACTKSQTVKEEIEGCKSTFFCLPSNKAKKKNLVY